MCELCDVNAYYSSTRVEEFQSAGWIVTQLVHRGQYDCQACGYESTARVFNGGSVHLVRLHTRILMLHRMSLGPSPSKRPDDYRLYI